MVVFLIAGNIHHLHFLPHFLQNTTFLGEMRTLTTLLRTWTITYLNTNYYFNNQIIEWQKVLLRHEITHILGIINLINNYSKKSRYM